MFQTFCSRNSGKPEEVSCYECTPQLQILEGARRRAASEASVQVRVEYQILGAKEA